ncbi:uncharacterized protein ARMOST_10237 [Armillaria ostoyae]|uniref:Ribosomal RNA methyltransferase FtsJ domain-containing protein n=1 Tax=Armillaria ostoyae TaxID=47428 RepID=A0A284RDV2_ARMOS|nr:uncharacterized protein ARMOST_10237 [Armillaria ostoyae]
MSFRPTLAALSKKSSTQGIVCQRHDHDVKHRASSSYNDVNVVVDLGVAPGGWSQAASQHSGYGSDEDSEPLPSTLPRVRATDLPIRHVLAATTTFSISTQSKRSLLAAKAGDMGPSLPLTFELNHD